MDNLTPEQRKKNMKNIRSKNTIPERIIMKELKKRKIYFAKNVKKIIGKPDIVFRRKRLVVFIDSDFWHRHPTKFVMPKSNKEYWGKKIKRNVIRDKEVNKQLNLAGWIVLRFWEKDIKKNKDWCIGKILTAYKNL